MMRGMKYIQFHALPEASLLCNGIKQPSQYHEAHIQTFFLSPAESTVCSSGFLCVCLPKTLHSSLPMVSSRKTSECLPFLFGNFYKVTGNLTPLTEDEDIYDRTVVGHHVPCDMQAENGNHLAGAASSVVHTAGCSAPLHPVTAERNKWAAILCGIAPLAASREDAQATQAQIETAHKCCFRKTGDVTISAHFWYLGISRGYILF